MAKRYLEHESRAHLEATARAMRLKYVENRRSAALKAWAERRKQAASADSQMGNQPASYNAPPLRQDCHGALKAKNSYPGKQNLIDAPAAILGAETRES